MGENSWDSVLFDMPWGQRLYRWMGKTVSGYPATVEAWDNTTREWVYCPNVNVHKRIKDVKYIKGVTHD